MPQAKIFILSKFGVKMAQDTLRMPSGTGGLVNYYDEYKSNLQIKPAYVIVFIILAIAFEIALRAFA